MELDSHGLVQLVSLDLGRLDGSKCTGIFSLSCMLLEANGHASNALCWHVKDFKLVLLPAGGHMAAFMLPAVLHFFFLTSILYRHYTIHPNDWISHSQMHV
jgi:hypothetical protein